MPRLRKSVTHSLPVRTASLPKSAKAMLAERLALRAFRTVKAGWPVDTGRSKRGLRYEVKNVGRRVYIRFTNTQDYAFFVEKRWYPIDDVLTPERLDELAAQVATERRR